MKNPMVIKLTKEELKQAPKVCSKLAVKVKNQKSKEYFNLTLPIHQLKKEQPMQEIDLINFLY